MNKKVIHTDIASVLPLIVIVGPTASGKSALALAAAQKYNGEIICADSRTVYKYMDIGTAKPTTQDQLLVPHWGIDLVEPNQSFTAADFKRYANQKIYEIRSRGHVPLLVGGTGLYIDGVIFDYTFAPEQPKVRQKLSSLSTEELIEYCKNNNINLPENDKNRRYIIRAIERKNTSIKGLSQPIPHTYIVGITTESTVLRDNIATRARELFVAGMVEEALLLGEKYGWESEAMTGNIYKLVKKYSLGEVTKSELLTNFISADWHLAKRQRTWFKRNPYITWKSLPDASLYIDEVLRSSIN